MISGRNAGNDTYHSALSIEDKEQLDGATALVEGLSDIVQHFMRVGPGKSCCGRSKPFPERSSAVNHAQGKNLFQVYTHERSSQIYIFASPTLYSVSLMISIQHGLLPTWERNPFQSFLAINQHPNLVIVT